MVSGWQQALTLIIVLIPGFVYQGVKRHRVGPSLEDQDLSIRLLRALVTSVIFLVVYAIALGDFLADRFLESDPQQRYDDVWAVGLIVGGLVFFIPAVAGHVSAAYLTRKRYFSSADSMTFWETVRTTAEPDDNELSWGRALFSRDTDYSPIPTAWDFATQDIPVGSFVRVLLPDDTWLGGQASTLIVHGSSITTGCLCASFPDRQASGFHAAMRSFCMLRRRLRGKTRTPTKRVRSDPAGGIGGSSLPALALLSSCTERGCRGY